jgi:hypothetical protein
LDTLSLHDALPISKWRQTLTYLRPINLKLGESTDKKIDDRPFKFIIYNMNF